MGIVEIISVILISVGFFFTVVATIGVIRLPDFYCRLHASGKCETLGLALAIFGLAIYNGFNLTSLKLLLVILFVVLSFPTGAHIVSRAAYKAGLKPWVREEE